MNTLFTVTCFKGTTQEAAYSIDLGVDVLDGLDEDTIRTMASQSKVIKIQSPLRKMVDRDAIAAYLVKHYPDSVVTDGVVRQPSEDAVLKGIIKAVGREKALELLQKHAADKS